MQEDSWQHHKKMLAILASPVTIILLFFFVVPLITIFLYSFGERDGLTGITITGTIEHYIRALQPDFMTILIKSLWIAFSASFLCLLIAFPIAYVIHMSPTKIGMLLLVLLMLPFWINILVRTYALIGFLGQRGIINSILTYFWNAVGLDNIARFQPLPLLYNDMAIIIGIIYDFLPFMVLPIYLSLQKIDFNLLEAARDLGANFWQCLYHIILPLSIPGIIAGFVIVFIPSLGAFYIPAMIGGTDSQLIGNIIERQFTSANNYPLGAALSVILILMMLISIYVRNISEKKQAVYYGR